MANFIVQRPTPPNEWLYRDENETRIFSDYIMRPEDSPAWLECTQAEKEQWDREHPIPTPEDAE